MNADDSATARPTALEIAQDVKRRPWRGAPVPVPCRSKNPGFDDWQHFRVNDEELPQRFNGREQNVGVLTGEPSNGIVSVDLDSREAILLAPRFLPPTGSMYGRKSKRRSHWNFIAQPVPKTATFQDPTAPAGEAMIAEVLSTGRHTLWPGSTNPSGEVVEWDEDGEPARVDGRVLVRSVARLSAAALIAAHWPAQGCRHFAALALAGGLLGSGWKAERVEEFIRAVAEAAGDDEIENRVRGVGTTKEQMDADEPATGWPRLSELVGEGVTKSARKWLGAETPTLSFTGRGNRTGEAPPPDEPPPGADEGFVGFGGSEVPPDGEASPRQQIMTTGRWVRQITEDSIGALLVVNQPAPTIFIHGNTLARIGRRSPAEVETLNQNALRGVLDRAADYLKALKDGGLGAARVPVDVVADLMSLPEVPLPPLIGIRHVPCFVECEDASARLLAVPGYDAATGVYLDLAAFSGDLPELDIYEALRWLLGELLYDFPFADDASRCHAVGMLVQPFVRDLIRGPAPLYLVEAPTRGTGKGLLLDLVSIVAVGRLADVTKMLRNEDEFEKRVTAALMKSPAMVVLDEARELRSGTLQAVLTTTRWQGRVLGYSRMVTVPNLVLWSATGNNIEMSDEMARRICPIRLDAGVECPEDRGSWKHENIIEWALAHRRQLVASCLSLARHWINAGRPLWQGTALGRFEGWSRTLGGIVTHAGIPDFLANRDRLRQHADHAGGEWHAVCESWWREFAGKPITAGDLLPLLMNENLLAEMWAGRNKLSALQRLGHELARHRDRVFGPFAIREAGRGSGNRGACFRLEEIAAGSPTP